MYKKTVYDYAARLVVVILFLFMCTILLRFSVRTFLIEGMGMQNRFTELVMFDIPGLTVLQESVSAELPENAEPITEPVAVPIRDRDGIIWSTVIDWQALYPAAVVPTPPAVERPETVFDRFCGFVDALRERSTPYRSRVEDMKSRIEDYTTDYVVFYNKMVELAGAYDKYIDWEIAGLTEYNPVIMPEANYFISCKPRQDMQAKAEQVISLRDYVQSLGMEHCYVQTPSKVCRDDIVSGTDFSNSNADDLLARIRLAGVDSLDLRDSLHADGMEHHAAFYETDHHWRAETGLWAAGEVAALLNTQYGFSIDLSLFSPEQYRYECYEDWFLGSSGKKVTLSRATPEDFTMIYPTFDTALHIEIPSLAVEKTGDFSIMYRYAPMDSCDYYNLNPYGAYFYGDNALTHVYNKNIEDGKRILILGDSFDNSLVPFLALGVSHVDSMDLREFSGSLETYLQENHYDIVIECYSS